MIAALLAIAISAAEPSPYFLDGSTIVQISCADDSAGSAFYIGEGLFVTARHVVAGARCSIKGKPIKIVQLGHGWVDFALIRAAYRPPFRAVISCAPLREGEQYFATGFAEAHPWAVTQRLIGTRAREPEAGAGHSESELVRGSTISGQSGGPVSDQDGLVRGIVSAGPDEGISEADVLQLADTPLCKGKS